MYFLANRFIKFKLADLWPIHYRFWFRFRVDPRPIPSSIPIFKTMDTTATKTDVFGCWCKLIEWPYDPAGIAELEFSLWGLLKAKTKILQEPKQMSKWIQHPIMDILETTTYINPSCRSRLLFFMSLSFQLRLQGTEKDYLNLGHYC